ncbi:MAG: SLC45 family MFS transporter [Clostridiaceae bacterium]|nr:SLC45 family MFS transporter [Clostridiaceae bacterium]
MDNFSDKKQTSNKQSNNKQANNKQANDKQANDKQANNKQANGSSKLNYGKTFLIGTGFFASSLLWSLYNSFVPLILKDFITSSTLIGLIMTIDNAFGVIFQPLFGSLSDRTQTRFGKRMPFIMIAAPLCAVLFFFIPQMPTLFSLMLIVIIFNFGMSVWRAPIVALMPDLTPSQHWSKANGVINLMGGVASIIAFLIGGKIANSYGRSATFGMGSIVMFLAVLTLFMFVKEPVAKSPFTSTDKKEDDKKSISLSAFKNLPAKQRRNLVYLLFAIFFWFCGFNAVETFFTTFAVENLGVPEGSAAMLLAFFSVSFVAFAIPAGFIATKIGRRKSIMIGLTGLVIVFIPILFLMNLTALRILLLIGGFFWALVNINSLPMVLEIGTKAEIGTYTGYYYFFSFSASIFSPIVFGFIRDLTQNYATLFIYTPIVFAIALFCISCTSLTDNKA